MSGNYSESDYIRIGQITNTRYILAGTVSRTANNYMLELAVSDAETGERKASYPPKPVSLLALENLSAVKEAAVDLLGQLGVRLTEQSLRELKAPVNTARIQGETALARGITAQRQGTEVAALSYFFQAAAFEPALVEAVNRSSILSANISSGNIGEDARNDIQWRRNWVARLTETEQFFNSYFDNFFKTLPSMPYTLYYASDIKQIGEINYEKETVTLGGMEALLRPSHEWVQPIELVLRSMQSSVQAVLNGLNATGRKAVWGLDKWPASGSFNMLPFGRKPGNFSIAVELMNSRNQVIGRQTFQTSGFYELPVPLPGRDGKISISPIDNKTINFPNVDANTITDNLTIRIVSVNGTAARNGVLQVQAVSNREFQIVRLNMVWIPAGTFTMGSPSNEAGRNENEGPQRQVILSNGFWMGKNEVTQKEYRDIMGTNPSNFKGDTLPVENVSWFDAIEYCNRRSQFDGLIPTYIISGTGNYRTVTWNRNANGYRLPTEAEWEYACRAGTTSAYNTGATINDNTGWYSANSGNRTNVVGLKLPNNWGLYDMHGNVMEWCWDWYGSYASGAHIDPTGATSGSYRVFRGGSWVSDGQYLRSAYRDYGNPYYRDNYIGFRLVRP